MPAADTQQSYVPIGGIVVYDGRTTSLSNLRQSTALDSRPADAPIDLQSSPSIMCACIPSSSAQDQVAALTAVSKSNGVALAVSNLSGNPLAVTPTGSLPAPATGQTITKVYTTGKTQVALVAGTGLLLYTVTAGKTLYITDLVFSSFVNGTMELRDGITIAGVTVYGALVGANTSNLPSLATPIPCTTGVFLDVGTSQNYLLTIYGYEA